MNTKVLPCPFCGEDAEADRQQSFRALSDGKIHHGVAIYCPKCPVNMSLSRADLPEYTDDELYDVLVEKWNARNAGWQPIETAPKDGSEILGWRSDAGSLIIRWTAPCEFWTDSELEKMPESSTDKWDWFYADFVAGGRLEGDETPTHWMPLPRPPQPI